MKHGLAALALLALGCSGAHAATCTALADATTGQLLRQEGPCGARVTPASTFKVALSLIGYDSGYLSDEHLPALPFKPGYADWIPSWRATRRCRKASCSSGEICSEEVSQAWVRPLSWPASPPRSALP